MAVLSPPPPQQQTPLSHSPFPSHTIPTLGYGTCETTTCTESALLALHAGYRHLDTAQIYQNESAVGAAIHTFLTSSENPTAVARSNLFITSKLWETTPAWTRASALTGVRDSLHKLGLEYLDLYLIHTPRPGRIARREAWLGLQDAVELGLVRAIGVSNWAPKHIEQLMREEGVKVKPCVNQLEVHPWRQQRGVREWCEREGVVCVAYSPLGQGKRLVQEGGVVGEVARGVGKTEAQVVLRWGLQRGLVVIPKSDKKGRIEENKGVWGWELGEEEMGRLDALDEGWAGATGEWDPEAWD